MISNRLKWNWSYRWFDWPESIRSDATFSVSSSWPLSADIILKTINYFQKILVTLTENENRKNKIRDEFFKKSELFLSALIGQWKCQGRALIGYLDNEWFLIFKNGFFLLLALSDILHGQLQIWVIVMTKILTNIKNLVWFSSRTFRFFNFDIFKIRKFIFLIFIFIVVQNTVKKSWIFAPRHHNSLPQTFSD